MKQIGRYSLLISLLALGIVFAGCSETTTYERQVVLVGEPIPQTSSDVGETGTIVGTETPTREVVYVDRSPQVVYVDRTPDVVYVDRSPDVIYVERQPRVQWTVGVGYTWSHYDRCHPRYYHGYRYHRSPRVRTYRSGGRVYRYTSGR